MKILSKEERVERQGKFCCDVDKKKNHNNV